MAKKNEKAPAKTEKVPRGYTRSEWKQYQDDPVGWCIKELASAKSSVRFNAADILRALAGDAAAAIPALIAGFDDRNKEVHRQCVFALVDIGSALKSGAADAVPALVKALSSRDTETRALAATALGEIGPASAPALEALIAALDDKDPEVRKAAERAVAQVRT